MGPVKTLIRFQASSLVLFSSIFFFNKPKTPTLWTTLTFWILNVSTAVTALTYYHTIFFWTKILVPYRFVMPTAFCHFSPPIAKPTFGPDPLPTLRFFSLSSVAI
jgi:hypothetical protein